MFWNKLSYNYIKEGKRPFMTNIALNFALNGADLDLNCLCVSMGEWAIAETISTTKRNKV